MNIYKNLSTKYGRDTLHEARLLEKQAIQTASWANHLTFTHRCKQSNVTPPSLRLFTTAKGEAAREVITNAERKLTQLRIGHCHERLRCLRTATHYTTATLTSTLTTQEFNNLNDVIRRKTAQTHDTTKDRQKRKLARLITPKPPPHPTQDPPTPPPPTLLTGGYITSHQPPYPKSRK
jgi:hypothetical protein